MSADTLTSLLWVIGGVGLTYFMMARGGGCGSHSHGSAGGEHSHGGAGGEHEHGGGDAASSTSAARSAPPVDPVCGMPVAKVTPALQRTYRGRSFFFCSDDCLRKFDADSPRYAREQDGQAHRHAHAC